MSYQKRVAKNFDFTLLGVVVALVALGLVAVYSATHSRLLEAGSDPFFFLKRQVMWVIIGLVGLGLAVYLDYEVLGKFSKYFYLGMLALLTLVLVTGKLVSGSQSWFRIAGLASFQPSELAKIAVILFLAKYLEGQENLRELRSLVVPFAIVLIPMGLILLQPDLGTAMVFVGILFGMLYIAGANPKHLGGIITAALAVSPLIFFYVLKDYQRNRIIVLINPYSDPVGAGYNVIQSMIAIGSGRLWGKGLFSGSQTQLNFVPEHHTDFIFSVIGEEFGFIGGLFVLAAYFLLLWRGLVVSYTAKDRYGSLVAAGVVSMLFTHVLINIGMNMGIMPVTGIPLPFLSYGGSSLLTNMVGIGLLVNIYGRRHKLRF
ncbi:MAG: rod shape-determining protein RodA [Firmicutes bacterium]|nr:rod shape-determining protein RodA [Bacillota bacterium]